MDKKFCFRSFRIVAALAMGISLLIFLLPACGANDFENPALSSPEHTGEAAPADKANITSNTAKPPSSSASTTSALTGRNPTIESTATRNKGIDWSGVLLQSATFLGIEQGYRLGTQPGTREALKGKFFDDWFESVTSIHGWGDEDDFLANYIGHPMEGSVVGNIFVHNDPRGRDLVFGWNSAYWTSRLKATAWSALYSTQFELGPISEASIGNVGHFGKSQCGAVDLVTTPLAGLGWQVGEDVLDKHLIVKIENRTSNPVVLMLVRSFLNPTRSFANVMRFAVPWSRDTRPGIWGNHSQNR